MPELASYKSMKTLTKQTASVGNDFLFCLALFIATPLTFILICWFIGGALVDAGVSFENYWFWSHVPDGRLNGAVYMGALFGIFWMGVDMAVMLTLLKLRRLHYVWPWLLAASTELIVCSTIWIADGSLYDNNPSSFASNFIIPLPPLVLLISYGVLLVSRSRIKSR